MLDNKSDFLDEVLDFKRKSTNVPNCIPGDLVETITTRQLVDLLNEFTFSSAEVLLDDQDSMFNVAVEFGNLIFFSNVTWSANQAEDFFGIMVTLPIQFDAEFISKFNQNTKIGRLYTIGHESEVTMFRTDVHLFGGVSTKHIFLNIKTFIDCYQHLYAGVLSTGATYEH